MDDTANPSQEHIAYIVPGELHRVKPEQAIDSMKNIWYN